MEIESNTDNKIKLVSTVLDLENNLEVTKHPSSLEKETTYSVVKKTINISTGFVDDVFAKRTGVTFEDLTDILRINGIKFNKELEVFISDVERFSWNVNENGYLVFVKTETVGISDNESKFPYTLDIESIEGIDDIKCVLRAMGIKISREKYNNLSFGDQMYFELED